MKALTYDGVGKIKVVDKDKPKIELPTQAIVKLVRTTICGTVGIHRSRTAVDVADMSFSQDLHIIKGDVPTVEQGRTLGHEGIGIVEEIGEEVKNFKKGDRVLIACITSCATCNFCKKR
jgi:alcohol dehydrogenase